MKGKISNYFAKRLLVFSKVKRGKITEEEFKFLTGNHEKVAKLGKMYLLWCTPSKKVLKFFDSQFKSILDEGFCYILWCTLTKQVLEFLDSESKSILDEGLC